MRLADKDVLRQGLQFQECKDGQVGEMKGTMPVQNSHRRMVNATRLPLGLTDVASQLDSHTLTGKGPREGG